MRLGRILAAATLLCSLSLCSTDVAASAAIGMPAPAFVATDSNGGTVTLSALKGKTVVLEWSNDGCPFVRKQYRSGNMQSLQKAFTAQGVVWLTVISSAPGRQGYVNGAQANRLSRERNAAPSAVLLDPQGELGHIYDAKTTPHVFVIDKNGGLVYSGGVDSIDSTDPSDISKAVPYLKNALTETLANRSVTMPLTRPYGCSVKYAG
ncbi:MAG: redoxin domain-containing protein [Nevskia sp.]|nr:redoxin domain-containing protein [Nevskia sp.]